MASGDNMKFNWKEKAQVIREMFVKKRGDTLGSDNDRRYLALALGGEVGEMQNLIKKEWRGDVKKNQKKELRHKIAMELADIRIYLEHLANAHNVDLDAACEEKTEELRTRWPQINKPILKAEKKKGRRLS